MHLVYLNPVGTIGGAERVMFAAIRQVRLQRPDWRISAVLAGSGPFAEKLSSVGVHVIVLPLPAAAAGVGDTALRGPGRKLGKIFGLGRTAFVTMPAGIGYLRRLRRTLRELQPSLLHSNGLKTHLLNALARPRRVPVIWHVHDFYSQRPLMAKILRRLRGGVTAAFAISEAVKRDAETVFPGVPVTTVLNAVDTDHFAPAHATMLLGSPGILRIGLVATYANWKGQDVFLDAIAALPRDLAFRAYVIGGPIYATAGSQFTRGDLEARAAHLGIADRVEFIPFENDPAEVYRALDVVVHASVRPEPFGLTIAEAMACGRPVIVARAGGAAELFTPGVDAVAHEPGNIASLAHAMETLLRDEGLRNRLAGAARQTALSRFAEPRFGREVIEVYERVAGINH